MNTPTTEEVKKACEEIGMYPPSNFAALKAFAQHWMKVQRESDAKLFEGTINIPFFRHAAEAIRNNTGE